MEGVAPKRAPEMDVSKCTPPQPRNLRLASQPPCTRAHTWGDVVVGHVHQPSPLAVVVSTEEVMLCIEGSRREKAHFKTPVL